VNLRNYLHVVLRFATRGYLSLSHFMLSRWGNYSFYAESLYLTYHAKNGDWRWNKFRVWKAYYTKNIPERYINTHTQRMYCYRQTRPLFKIFCKIFCYWLNIYQERKLTPAKVTIWFVHVSASLVCQKF
jgi:hypothetical protein